MLEIGCDEHGQMVSYPAPPGAYTGRSLRELARVVITRALTNIDLSRQEICPRCWGQTEPEFRTDPPTTDVVSEDEIWVGISCSRCWLQYKIPLRIVVTAHPSTRAFYAEHGFTEIEMMLGSGLALDPTVCSIDLDGDGTATVTITLDDERLVLTLDETCAVTPQRRETA